MLDDTKTTVIVVDDDAGLCASLEMLLAAAGYVCASCGSVEAYLKRSAAARQPGCILLDVELPGMSGFELQRLMRVRAPDLPIIFLTASGREDDARQARAAGAAAFLHKPVDPDQLLDQIARVTAGH